MARQRPINPRHPKALQAELKLRMEADAAATPEQVQEKGPKPEKKKEVPVQEVLKLTAEEKLQALPNKDLKALAALHLIDDELKLPRKELIAALVKADVYK